MINSSTNNIKVGTFKARFNKETSLRSSCSKNMIPSNSKNRNYNYSNNNNKTKTKLSYNKNTETTKISITKSKKVKLFTLQLYNWGKLNKSVKKI